MKDLSTYIELREGEKVVDSRKIHAFLGVSTRHSTWMPRKIEELTLENGKDYFTQKCANKTANGKGRQVVVYYLTQRAAEHIGMAETTEKGTIIRDAFIAARDAGKRLAESEAERRSKEARKSLASQWAGHGLRGRDFGDATIKEYEVIFNDRSIRKPMMDNRQRTALMIFEAIESMKLEGSATIHGLEEVKDSLAETGRELDTTFRRLRISGVKA